MADTRKTLPIRLVISILFVLLICAPLRANYPAPADFRSTSAYPINAGSPEQYSRQWNAEKGEQYRTVIYEPFSNGTPSQGGNPANNSGGGSDDGEDVGIPDWGGTMSEPLPIADGTLFLLLLAVIATTTIAIKQHKQKQSTMKTHKLTYRSNRLQKLFLLLAFVCFVGQVSGQTFHVKQLFKLTKNADLNFPSSETNSSSKYTHTNYSSWQAPYIKGAFYAAEYGRTRILKITEDGTVTNFATGVTGLKSGICRDDAGNLIAHISSDATKPNKIRVYPATSTGPATTGTKDITFTTLDAKDNTISASGDVLGGTGYVYFFPASKTYVQIVTITQGVASSTITKHTGLDVTCSAGGGYVIPISGTTRYIYNERNVDHEGFYHYNSGDKGVYMSDVSYSQTAPNRNAAYGGAFFKIGTNEMFIHPSGTDYAGGWTLRNMSNSQSVIHNESKFGNWGNGTAYKYNASTGYFFNVEKVSDYTIKLYEYCMGHGIGGWEISGLAAQTYNIATRTTGNYTTGGSGGTFTVRYTTPATSTTTTTTTTSSITSGTYNVLANTSVTLTATAASGYKFMGWYNGSTRVSTDATYSYTVSSTNTIQARFQKVRKKDVRIQTYNGSSWIVSNTGGYITFKYNNGSDRTVTIDNSNDPNSYTDVFEGTQFTCTAYPKTGYTFIGWWNNSKGQFTANPWTADASATDQSITARFAQCYTQTPHNTFYNPETGTFQDGDTGGTVTITYDDGLGKSSGKENKTATVSTSGTYRTIINSTTTLTASPKAGYVFIGWYSGETKLNWATGIECAYISDASYSISARFVPIISQTFKVQTYETNTYADGGNGGSITIQHSNDQSTITESTVTISNMYQGYNNTLTAVANDGYAFVGWYNYNGTECFTRSTTYVYKAMGPRTVIARFVKLHEQNLKVEQGGAVAISYNDGSDKTATLPLQDNGATVYALTFHSAANSTVTLTATPNSGYRFKGWLDETTGKYLPTSATIYSYAGNESKRLNAHFEPAQQTHTVAIMTYDPSYNKYLPDDPGGSVTYTVRSPGQVPDSEITTTTAASFIVPVGKDVTLTATAREGYKFLGWYEGETLRSESTTHTYSATDVARHFTARFAPSNTLTFTLIPNSAGTYTVKYGNADAGIATFSSKQSSLTKREKVIVPNPYKYTVVSAKPILGYAFHCFYFGGYEDKPDKQEAQFNELSLTQTADRRVVVNFVRTDEQMVYLHLNNQWAHSNHTYYVYAANIAKRTNANETDLQFEWIPMELVAGQNYYKASRPIPANKYSHIVFTQFASGKAANTNQPITAQENQAITNKTGYLTIPATRFDCYKLQSYWKNGAYHDAWINCPEADGDFRLLYSEDNYEHASDIIKKAASGKIDTVSLHIYKERAHAWVKLQKRAGDTWADLLSRNINDLHTGVYNFVIQQNESGTTPTITEVHPYEGNYYIRTANAEGMYQDYTHPDNIMTYSAYADAHSDFSHYYCRDIDIPAQGLGDGDRVGNYTSVKFAVANDYAYFLSKELLISNDRFTDDQYGTDNFVEHRDGIEPRLSADAAVRFGWDIKTNRLTRAYIVKEDVIGDERLIIEGTDITSTTFTEQADHIYLADLQAKPNTSATVRTKMIVDTDPAQSTFHNEYRNQYLFGAEGSPEPILAGTNSETYYPIRMLYDFKQDRFTTTYTPNGEITGNINLETPLMIMREHNNPPTQVTFPTSGNNTITLPDGTDAFAQPAYAVMTFLGSKLTDPAITHHEKMFYWVSFPYNVKIKDVFGLGKYGQYWIMQYYDGAQRAQYGLKYTNWKYITNTGTELKANKGYIICLNYSQLVTDGIVATDKNVSLYFPSNSSLSAKQIQGGQTITIDLPSHERGNNIAWNHWDWHVIGVPSFANPDYSTTRVNPEAPFIYQYDHAYDAYGAVAPEFEQNFQFYAMHAYMVQYAGEIIWTSVVNTPQPLGLGTRRDVAAEERPMLRLELQQTGNLLDKTYVQLRDEEATLGFDLNKDLSKVINAGANIYSVVNGDQMAGNVILKSDNLLPLGVVITDEGEYTFSMPQGTGGMEVELIDYQTNTRTNLLLGDYTVTLPKGTIDGRFALSMRPDKTATSVENIDGGAKGDKAIRKLLIDGRLYIQQGNLLYDAQGRIVMK